MTALLDQACRKTTLDFTRHVFSRNWMESAPTSSVVWFEDMLEYIRWAAREEGLVSYQPIHRHNKLLAFSLELLLLLRHFWHTSKTLSQKDLLHIMLNLIAARAPVSLPWSSFFNPLTELGLTVTRSLWLNPSGHVGFRLDSMETTWVCLFLIPSDLEKHWRTNSSYANAPVRSAIPAGHIGTGRYSVQAHAYAWSLLWSFFLPLHTRYPRRC